MTSSRCAFLISPPDGAIRIWRRGTTCTSCRTLSRCIPGLSSGPYLRSPFYLLLAPRVNHCLFFKVLLSNHQTQIYSDPPVGQEHPFQDLRLTVHPSSLRTDWAGGEHLPWNWSQPVSRHGQGASTSDRVIVVTFPLAYVTTVLPVFIPSSPSPSVPDFVEFSR
jgi:hypothetical protein